MFEMSDTDLGAIAAGGEGRTRATLYGNGYGNDTPYTDPVDPSDPAEQAG